MVSVFADLTACRRVAYENVLDAAAEGIDYIELRFSPWFMAEPQGLEPGRCGGGGDGRDRTGPRGSAGDIRLI